MVVLRLQSLCSGASAYYRSLLLSFYEACYLYTKGNPGDHLMGTQDTDDAEGESELELPELHSLLGNETRLQIMQCLWDEFEFVGYVTRTQEGLSFEALREQIGVADSGNFNYHLGLLTETLIEDGQDGYVLTPYGYNVMSALDRYSTFEYATLEPWDVAESCPFCGGVLRAEYNREMLSVTCTDCNPLSTDGDFTYVQLPSKGVGNLDRQEVLDAATGSLLSSIRTSMYGSCGDCGSPMEAEFRFCDEHEPDETDICPSCDHRYAETVDVSCSSCGAGGHGPVVEYAAASDAVSAAFTDIGHGPAQIGPWRYRLTIFEQLIETTRRDGDTVEISLAVGDDILRVSIQTTESGVVVRRLSDSGE